MRTFGHIENYPPGSLFDSRKHLSEAGVHKPTQAGISGSQFTGASSIVLSGGYEDDEDYGATITYTGAGGRDPATGAQVSNQLLTRANLALAKSGLEGLPVRVVRGSSYSSPYAPDSGYRYDGLYYVEDYWREQGKSGYYVWRFRLVQGQDALSAVQFMGTSAPERKLTFQQRIVRSTATAQRVKEIHGYRCQVCGFFIQIKSGPYAEAAHIQPLGRPHNGPDVPENILCLYPNHHVMFDNGVFVIGDDMSLVGIVGTLRLDSNHQIDAAYILYHRERYSSDL